MNIYYKGAFEITKIETKQKKSCIIFDMHMLENLFYLFMCAGFKAARHIFSLNIIYISSSHKFIIPKKKKLREPEHKTNIINLCVHTERAMDRLL
jgi:hypothetical protein